MRSKVRRRGMGSVVACVPASRRRGVRAIVLRSIRRDRARRRSAKRGSEEEAVGEGTGGGPWARAAAIISGELVIQNG